MVQIPGDYYTISLMMIVLIVLLNHTAYHLFLAIIWIMIF